RMIAAYDQSLVARVAELEDDLREQGDALEAAMSELGRLRQAQLAEVAELHAIELEHRSALARYRSAEADAVSQLDRLVQDAGRLEATVADLETQRTNGSPPTHPAAAAP